MQEKIKIILVKRNMSANQLAQKLGTSSSNLYHKFKRNNFTTNELQKIGDALNCDFIGKFKLRDTGEEI